MSSETSCKPQTLNVADRLGAMAAAMPDATAIVEPRGRGRRRRYVTVTFRELQADVDRIARGLQQLGVEPGTRLVLLVPMGIDFITLTFAILRAGAVVVLIDPGMGLRPMIGCLEHVQADGFVALARVQAVRRALAGRLAGAVRNVTVPGPWFWSGPTLETLRRAGSGSSAALPRCSAEDPAAIIFTSGSTGPAKGVLYCHENFDAQIVQIRDQYGIEPGRIDLAGFPLFGLFDAAMGVTTVVPAMDASRPGRADPRRIVENILDWKVNQAFGSPALWDRVGRYCEAHHVRLPSLRTVFSAGAAVPTHVLRRMTAAIAAGGTMHTPYGATEALPVATISASEVLAATAAETERGAGVCVGRKFPLVQWQVIRPVDGPIAAIDNATPVAVGEVGELIVRGPQVTRRYVTGSGSNAMAKIADPEGPWHRLGDLGYMDAEDRFWVCGRVGHRVQTAAGPMDTLRCEAIFNRHPAVRRSALVGVGPAGRQTPVVVVEAAGPLGSRAARRRLFEELRELARGNHLTDAIDQFLCRRKLPVDVRHNAKISREQLARWAARRLPAGHA